MTGLRLVGRDGPPVDGVVPKLITVTAGIAVDGAGREIVVPADIPLRPQQFDEDIGPAPSLDPSHHRRHHVSLPGVHLAGRAHRVGVRVHGRKLR